MEVHSEKLKSIRRMDFLRIIFEVDRGTVDFLVKN